MALYGWALHKGAGVAQDQPRGNQLLQQSKDPMARAMCLHFGIGVPEDHKACFRLLSTKCDTSDPHVHFLLGRCHHYGTGCPKNLTQAVKCYEQAGLHLSALNNKGFIETGDGATRDATLAVRLYRHAAEQGSSTAQYNLARMYEYGKGVPKDLQKAKHWYTLAAEQGDKDAKAALQQIA
eukprot:TRINITY_DN4431_c1_g1_i1.p1 TRINITY_DN4431_c1_g1~~TRINITY_DN4431_c1_g1_i1.p1  ORF type:complete len:193 (+),score=33.24 TRINITY_DN4431_c1_g1_i1:41-580(+)